MKATARRAHKAPPSAQQAERRHRKPAVRQQRAVVMRAENGDGDGDDDDDDDEGGVELETDDVLLDKEDEADIFATLNAMVDGQGQGGQDESNGNDEEEEHSPATTTKDKRGKPKSATVQHKKQLENLSQTDPEFYQYLKENDADLLQFAASDDDDDDDDADDGEGDAMDQDDDHVQDEEEEEDDDESEDGSGDEGEGHERKPTVLSKALLLEWVAAAAEPKAPVSALRRLLNAFRLAAHFNDELDQSVPPSKTSQSKTAKRKSAKLAALEKRFNYTIPSISVYSEIMRATPPAIIQYFNDNITVKSKGKSGQQQPLPQTSPQWPTMRVLVERFLSNLVHALRTILPSNDPKLVLYLLHKLETVLPYVACFFKIAKALLKRLLELWGRSDESTRVVTFLNIRRLCIVASSPAFTDLCLKGIYLTFVRNSAMTTPKTLPVIMFMSNCVVEMYGIDTRAGYQHAFVYIRQLAIHLRNAFNVKSKESFSAVYNWPFVHCLRVWGKVLAAYCARSRPGHPLDSKHAYVPLIYPLVQICLGTIRLIPTPRYFPLRLHCLHVIADLEEHTGILAPVPALLLEIIDTGALTVKTKPATLKRLDFAVVLRVPKAYLNTRVFQDGVTENMVELFLAHFAAFATHIAFPEMVVPTVAQLKKFIKQSSNSKANKMFQHQVIDLLEQNRTVIEHDRSSVDFSPKDTVRVVEFATDETRLKKAKLITYYQSFIRTKQQALKVQQHERDQQRARSGRTDEDDDLLYDEDGTDNHADVMESAHARRQEDNDDEDEDDEGDDEDEDEDNKGAHDQKEDRSVKARHNKAIAGKKRSRASAVSKGKHDDDDDDDFLAGFETVYDGGNDDAQAITSPVRTTNGANGQKKQHKKKKVSR